MATDSATAAFELPIWLVSGPLLKAAGPAPQATLHGTAASLVGMGGAMKAYDLLPADTLRKGVDSLFRDYAKCPYADLPPFGRYHRFERGHDVILDVTSTFERHGVQAAWHHWCHIILTDFPTKAGIPVAVVSRMTKSALMDYPMVGPLLRGLGMDRAWLNLSLFDVAIGLGALKDGTGHLRQALAGNLEMNLATFADTWLRGALEIIWAKGLMIPGTNLNILLWYAGLENILAGIVSTWKTVLLRTSAIELLSGAFYPALLSGGISWIFSTHLELHERAQLTLGNIVRAAALGSLFTIEVLFGYAAILGATCILAGSQIARRDRDSRQALVSITPREFEVLFRIRSYGAPGFIALWAAAHCGLAIPDSVTSTELYVSSTCELDSTAPLLWDIPAKHTLNTTGPAHLDMAQESFLEGTVTPPLNTTPRQLLDSIAPTPLETRARLSFDATCTQDGGFIPARVWDAALPANVSID